MGVSVWAIPHPKFYWVMGSIDWYYTDGNNMTTTEPELVPFGWVTEWSGQPVAKPWFYYNESLRRTAKTKAECLDSAVRVPSEATKVCGTCFYEQEGFLLEKCGLVFGRRVNGSPKHTYFCCQGDIVHSTALPTDQKW